MIGLKKDISDAVASSREFIIKISTARYPDGYLARIRLLKSCALRLIRSAPGRATPGLV